jgi:choice-of-anchor C domain-containing protein
LERFRITAWLAGLATALGLVAGVSAAPFQNGSFEDSVPSCTQLRGVGQPVGAGWVVSRGGVHWYNGNSVSPCAAWHAADGAGSLDLAGGGTTGGVSQTFDTMPGAIYRLTFAIAGNPGTSPPSAKPYDVYVDGVKLVGGTFDVTGRTPADMGWQVVTQYFAATSATTTLEFVSDITPYASAGAALDDVQVTMVSTPAGEFQNGSFELGPPQAQCG